jgi:hypothetical protein
MPLPDRIPDHPFDRFLAICSVLERDRSGQGAWLRFAAQAAVAAPGDPGEIAGTILSTAATLRAAANWLDPMHTPLRYLVAAMLVQAGDSVPAFEAELARARTIFRQAGIVHGGVYEIMAILLLRTAADGKPIDLEQVGRLRAIYHQLKRHHWWLTGAHDLPTCAMLLGLEGTPEEVGRTVEEVYHLLSIDGFSTGVQLLQAAHVLPLLRLPAQQAVHRYGALAHRFAMHGTPPWQQDYEAIAILSLLDQDVETITDSCLANYRKLSGIHPVLHHEVLIDLAANLAFLDLIHMRQRRIDPNDVNAKSLLERTVRDGRNVAAIIACFGASSIDPGSR